MVWWRRTSRNWKITGGWERAWFWGKGLRKSQKLSLDPSTLLQVTLFHFFPWLSNIPLCTCTTSLPIHLLMDFLVAPMS